MADPKSKLVEQPVEGNQPGTMELEQPPPDETPDDGRKGGGDDKSKSLGGKPGPGGYGRPNKNERAGE